MRCPRAMTSGGKQLAAKDETTAWRFWPTLTRLCQRRHVFVGQNMPPPRHMLPNAACPARWVPPPGTRGIRATARPVPHDSAAVSYPTLAPTANACRLFFETFVCTYLTRSGRKGIANAAGIGKVPVFAAASSNLYTDTTGLVVAMVPTSEIQLSEKQ